MKKTTNTFIAIMMISASLAGCYTKSCNQGEFKETPVAATVDSTVDSTVTSTSENSTNQKTTSGNPTSENK